MIPNLLSEDIVFVYFKSNILKMPCFSALPLVSFLMCGVYKLHELSRCTNALKKTKTKLKLTFYTFDNETLLVFRIKENVQYMHINRFNANYSQNNQEMNFSLGIWKGF